MGRSSTAAVAAVGATLLVLGGCELATLATATPSLVEVQQVELRGMGLLDQSLQVTLCVTNPNDTELDLRRSASSAFQP